MARATRINPERLSALREKARLSQKELAGRLGVNVGTVSRWERGTILGVRKDVFGGLCAELHANKEDLCGEGPFPPSGSQRNEPQRGQMNLPVDAACRNALYLVARRYGVTRQQIVEVAPLLFFIAAERSLQERRKRLSILWESADRLVEATPSYLPVRSPVDDTALHYEKVSIDVRDLFAEKVGRPDPNWDDATSNPFALFLSEILATASSSAEPVQWSPGLWPTYRVCTEEAAAIVGGDELATQAILSGSAELHEMPIEIRKASPAERADWARAEAKKKYGDLDKMLDELISMPPSDRGVSGDSDEGDAP